MLEIRHGQRRLQDGKSGECSPVVRLDIFRVQFDGFCYECRKAGERCSYETEVKQDVLVSATAPPYSSSFILAIALFPKNTDSRGLSRIA